MAMQIDEGRKPGKSGPNSRSLNSMLSMWYGVIVGCLQVYLIVQNVWKFVRFAELPWPNQKTPTAELNLFIGLNGMAVLFLPFFVTACFLKIGNLANDNQMIGKRLKCTEEWFTVLTKGKGKDSRSMFTSIWTHMGPVSSLIHIICSVCLLFPQIVMEAALIKHGFLDKDNVWKSDLDFMTNDDREDMVIRPIGSDNGAIEAIDFVKKVYPTKSRNDVLKLEFINYALALFIFSIQYAQVFWASNKKFAVILGFQQILNNIHTLISFCTLAILYKVHVAGVYQPSTPFLLNSHVTMLIFAISLTVLFISPTVLYYLGYLKFTSFLQEKIRKQFVAGPEESSFYGSGWIYFPHSAAVSIALALAAAQSPLVHDAFIVYQISSRSFLLAFPISSASHFLLWAILWLCLTLTKNWDFHINTTQPVEGLETPGLSAEITIDLGENSSNGPFSPPLLVISEGKAFSVNNVEDQRSILALVPQKGKNTEPLYWQKPSQTSTPSCLSYTQKDHSKIKYMPCRKEVTFDDELPSPRYYSRPPSRPDKSDWRNGSENCCANSNGDEFDAGEYAYLAGGHQLTKQNQVQRSTQGTECLYGQLPVKMSFTERSTVASPVDSSSGVSSISNKSNFGPPSSSASCSQFSGSLISTGETDQRSSIVEPTAHYEPARLLSRRNSVRSYVHPSSACEIESRPTQGLNEDEIYGKLRRGIPVGRSESIYSSGSCKLVCEARFNRSIYEKSPLEVDSKCNYSRNNPKFRDECNEQLNESNIIYPSSSNNSKMYGYLDDTGPPIPPPLPILSCVTRKSLSAVQSPSTTQVI